MRNIFFILLFSFFIQCKKDPGYIGVKVNHEYKTTPYTFVIPQGFPQINLPSGNPLTNEGILLGRMLFYDPILSADSSMSCATCHSQETSFSDNRRFSTGVYGHIGTKNSMPLFNLAWSERFFWDGRSPNLRDQVLHPIVDGTEMAHNLNILLGQLENHKKYKPMFDTAFNGGSITPTKLAMALEQFLLTIVSDKSRADSFFRRTAPLPPSAYNGFLIFNAEPPNGADCFHCHTTNLFTTFRFSNNGLDDEANLGNGYYIVTQNNADKGKFKTPSLRNLIYTAPYMHDGRFATLDHVIEFYNAHVVASSPNLDPQMDKIPQGLNLTAQQKADLKAFLLSLTDYTLVNNPAYKNPH